LAKPLQSFPELTRRKQRKHWGRDLPKPDANLCLRVDLPLDKKIVENQDWAAVGLRAARPSRAAGLLLANLVRSKKTWPGDQREELTENYDT